MADVHRLGDIGRGEIHDHGLAATGGRDAEARVTSWNQAATKLFGWTEEEVLGRELPYVPTGQEAEADDYSYDLLRQRGISPAGLATSFEKLAKLEEGRQSSMFDDHPASAERAQHIRDRMSADGIK